MSAKGHDDAGTGQRSHRSVIRCQTHRPERHRNLHRRVPPLLEEALARQGHTLAVLADRDNVPPVAETTTVVISEPSGAPMYSVAEQRAWNRAVQMTRPKAMWVPHYPFPFTLSRPANRRIVFFSTVHDDSHLLPENISGNGRARRMYARVMLAIVARRSAAIFTRRGRPPTPWPSTFPPPGLS